MSKPVAEPTRSEVRSGSAGPGRRCAGGLRRPKQCAVTLSAHDEIVLTVGMSNVFVGRHSARLQPGEARRLAADLLAFAGAVDGSSGD